MPIPTEIGPLTQLVERLGYLDPERFAKQVSEEGPHTLLSALFVHQAWHRYVVRDGDTHWIDQEIATAAAHPGQPYSGLGRALKRCREAGVPDEDLIEMARCHQAATIFHVCYLLDDPSFDGDELDDVAWSLFQVDQNGDPVGQSIEGMHEMVLGSDPTGREMRPNDASQEAPLK